MPTLISKRSACRYAMGFVSGLLLATPGFGAQDCGSLAKLSLAHVTISRAEALPAGDFAPPSGKKIAHLAALCRVAGVIAPSADSAIAFEVWMPSSGWNGKFQGIGNGGFAGAIGYGEMAAAVAHGYATASTDTGHQAEGTNAEWALHHPEKIVDYGYRAIHELAVTAKAIIHRYYGEPPTRSYFSGCSNGGRQALMEAQRFPEDYNGIVAGAPANYWTHLLANAVWDMQALLSDPASYIPAAKLPAIEAAALAACDAKDGVKDKVIEDPPHCRFDPSVLQCAGKETTSCLTGAQLTTLKKLYAGGQTSDGKQLFPGYEPGGEAEPAGWEPWITGPAPEHNLMFAFGTQFFKNMVFSDPAWDFRTFRVDRDTKLADEKMTSILNATSSDLSRFRARGGKLILYHGWSDAAIAPSNTINYYQSVIATMGPNSVHAFVRLFMVPGLQHCTGGQGPDDFGQGGVAGGDPERDINRALEHWVEQGVAPEHLIAAKREKSSEGAAGAVLRTRPLCAYPAIARYQGSGNTDDAASFACAKEERSDSK